MTAHLTHPPPTPSFPSLCGFRAKGVISLDLFVVVVFFQFERIDSDIVALRLSKLLALSKFLGLVFDDLLLDLP